MLREVPVLTYTMAVTGQTVTFDLLDAGFRIVEKVSLVECLHVVPARAMACLASRDTSAQLKRSKARMNRVGELL
jgi:hypothetical protein